jgi:hypothetical protein
VSEGVNRWGVFNVLFVCGMVICMSFISPYTRLP